MVYGTVCNNYRHTLNIAMCGARCNNHKPTVNMYMVQYETVMKTY